jgi:TolA-binding protein
MLNYTKTIDKASTLVRRLELDAAAELLLELLNEHPTDFELIERVFKLTKNSPQTTRFYQLCLYLFGYYQSAAEKHDLTLEAYKILKAQQPVEAPHAFLAKLPNKAFFNLFKHLARSYLTQDAKVALQVMKKKYPESSKTPEAIWFYCEFLIQSKNYIDARDQLKYLISFYAETSISSHAIKALKITQQKIKT